MSKKTKLIFLIVLATAASFVAIFFAQKYIRLYWAYMDFEDYQYYLSQRNEFYGEENEIKDWSFGRYLQYVNEAKGAEKKALAEQEKLLDVYRQDTIGGKTPEETWKSYLDAINNGDLELASKHWVEKERQSILTELQDLQEKNQLEEFFKDFPPFESWEFIKDDYWNGIERARFYYKFQSEDYPVKFELNPYSKIWKISSY